jgi:hypothetical protein
VENLECHRPVMLEILGEIDRGHAAAAELAPENVAVGQRGLQPGVNVRQKKARNELCAILQREQCTG